MANWCANTVEFKGDTVQMEGLERMFKAMAVREKAEDKGQLPGFITDEGGWFFDIEWEDGVLNYATKWSPNTAVVVDIADHFQVGFVHSYEETANGVYGEATYTDGVLTEVDLTDEDFAQYEWDEETDTYLFEGQSWESESEVLETLLERRKNLMGIKN